MSKVLSTITLAGLVAVGLPACATKKFVRQGVGEVNKKVDALGQSVEETQERTKRNEGAISDVDKKAQAAQGLWFPHGSKIDELQIQTGNVVVTGSKNVAVDVKE